MEALSDTQQDPPTPTSSLKERRFKLSRACDRCRRRRIKCDEGHPCQACLTTNSACTFEEPVKRTSHPHKSRRAASLEDRMHHLETLIKAIPPAVFAAGGAMPQSAGLPTPAFDQGKGQNTVTPFMNPGVPPPSLHVFPLINPSTHFSDNKLASPFTSSAPPSTSGPFYVDHAMDETSRTCLTASYLYFDDEGYTRWQGETSGLPVLDLLVEKHQHAAGQGGPDNSANVGSAAQADWFPDRQPRRIEVNPQALWKLITTYIVPELMDRLVQCYLSTSSYILPFLHVPTFLSDYGNPQKWAEPGFANFIVAVCCLASRHIDDARVRTQPSNGISSGSQWFELFNRLHTMSITDRPTPYNIQANLIAAVYAVGSGKLTKASALLAESCTMCVDAGLHRSADSYDLFDPIDDEVRKRTFWCVYLWDKQMSAHFGRPPILRLRDCDVGEPTPVDDEFINRDAIGTPPSGTESRMSAFIIALRIMVVLESVLDVPPTRLSDDPSSFLVRAASLLSGGRRFKEMREEEALLDDIHRSIPTFWAHTADSMTSEDAIRVTQAVRLHCAEHFVRLLIYRHRFSELIAERTNGPASDEQTEAERAALIAAHNCALHVIAANVNIAKRGLMTYYGVHVIHQLTQAGRTLVAVLLSCKTEVLQHLIPPGLDALRSCVGLLRRFSSRYVCGLRSGDLMEEFCRLTGIPLETSSQDIGTVATTRPPWIRPVRKKASSSVRSTHSLGDSPSHSSHLDSPEGYSPSEFLTHTPTLSSNKSKTPPPPDFPISSSFMDSSLFLHQLEEDTQLYLSPDLSATFSHGVVDSAALYGLDYLQVPGTSDLSQLESLGGMHHADSSNSPAFLSRPSP